MNLSDNICSPARARFVWLCCLGFTGLVGGSLQGRPIEFSEPTSSDQSINVSELGAKPADLPGAEDRVFMPHTYKSPRDIASGVKPLIRNGSFARQPVNRTPSAFDGDKSWLQQTPREMLQSMLEKDVLKLPDYGIGKKSPEARSSRDPNNLPVFRRNDAINPMGGGLATDRLDGSASLNLADPPASIPGRPTSPDFSANLDLNAGRTRNVADWLRNGDDSPADFRRGRSESTRQMEDFKRNQAFKTSAENSGWPNLGTTPRRGNAFVSDFEKSSRSPSGTLPLFLSTPVAPVAPTAPTAPGQPSLTPAPYSPAPATKPKPLNFSAPRRSF